MASDFYDPSKGFENNSDVTAEAAALARRQKLLDAMQQKALSPQFQGNTAQGIGQLLASLGTTWLLKGAQDDQVERMKVNERERMQSLSQNLNAFLDTNNGRPGQVMTTDQAANLMNGDVAPELADPIKADPRRAVVQAMASQHPELQAIGKMGMQELMKQGARPGFKDHMTQDGSLVRVLDDGTVKSLGNFAKPKDQWSEPFTIQGVDGKPLMVKRNLATNEVDVVDKAPKVTAKATANAKTVAAAGETEFAKVLGKDVAGEFKEARGAAQTAYKAKSFVNQMKKLEESGIFSGPTANIATTLSAVGQTLGLPVDEAKLANSQAFQQQFAAQVANVLTAGGGIGRSMTDADRKAFEQSLPTMLMTPQGRAQVYQMIEGQANQDIRRAQSFQSSLLASPAYSAHAGMLTLNPVDDTPLGASGGVVAPGAPAVQPQTAKPRVTNW